MDNYIALLSLLLGVINSLIIFLQYRGKRIKPRIEISDLYYDIQNQHKVLTLEANVTIKNRSTERLSIHLIEIEIQGKKIIYEKPSSFYKGFGITGPSDTSISPFDSYFDDKVELLPRDSIPGRLMFQLMDVSAKYIKKCCVIGMLRFHTPSKVIKKKIKFNEVPKDIPENINAC